MRDGRQAVQTNPVQFRPKQTTADRARLKQTNQRNSLYKENRFEHSFMQKKSKVNES